MQSRVPYLVVGVLSLLLSKLAGAQDYSWEEIVVPGATVVQAWQINDKGQVVVSTTIGYGTYANGTFTPLPPPPEGFVVAALGLNNDGVITGPASTAAGPNPGFILRGSEYTFFSREGWDTTAARSIANSGLITGYSSAASGFPNAGFIYDPETKTFTDATPPGSTNTITQGMNSSGRITGSGTEPAIGRYGFVWQQQTINKGKRELLPFLDRIKIDAGASTRGINDSGVVIGFISDATGRNDGFVGSDALGYQRLVAPGGEIPGNSTICSSINNLAQVVCYVWDSASQPVAAFIGTPSKG